MNEELKNKVVKTGTITLGIVFKDGVLLASDKRVSLGDTYWIADKKMMKLHKITDNIFVTMAGGVSDIQMVIKLARAELKLKTIRTKALPTVNEAANLFANIVYQNIRKYSTIIGISHFIMAGRDSTGVSLYEISPDGTIIGKDNYATSGAYGSIAAYGILENEWAPTMNAEEAKKLVMKIIKTSFKRDVSTGDGVNMVIIPKTGSIGEITEEKL